VRCVVVGASEDRGRNERVRIASVRRVVWARRVAWWGVACSGGRSERGGQGTTTPVGTSVLAAPRPVTCRASQIAVVRRGRSRADAAMFCGDCDYAYIYIRARHADQNRSSSVICFTISCARGVSSRRGRVGRRAPHRVRDHESKLLERELAVAVAVRLHDRLVDDLLQLLVLQVVSHLARARMSHPATTNLNIAEKGESAPSS
jgi:hypothetical protein